MSHPTFKPGNVFVDGKRGVQGIEGEYLIEIESVYKRPDGEYLYKVKWDASLYPEADLEEMERLLQVDW